MPHLLAAGWAVLVVAAVSVGFAKTAVNGTGAVSAALFALVLPARASTGALLPLLLVGDLVAIGLYRQHTNWVVIRRLLPWVTVGIVGGAAYVANIGDSGMRRTIGLLLLVLVGVALLTRGARAQSLLGDAGDGPMRAGHRATAGVAGMAAGKLPFSIGLGLVAPGALLLDLALVPALAAGAFGGVLLVRRINQQMFERVALALVGTSALLLFL